MKRFILSLFVLFTAACFLSGEIVNLSNLPSTSSTHPWVLASEGNIMVVWREEGGHSGVEKNIYYTVYHAGLWSTPQACYDTPVISKNPHIALSPEGIVHLGWADGPGSNREVYHGYFQDGKWQGSPELIYRSPYNSNWIKLQVSDEGNVLAAWASAMETGITDWWIIRANWKKNIEWNFTGKILSENATDTGEKNLAMYPQFSYRSGVAYVIWPQSTPAGSEIRFTECVDGVWSELRAITPLGTYTWPGLAIDSKGGVHVICSKTGGKVWYTSRAPAGKWSSLVAVNKSTQHQRGFTTLAVDTYDGLHAVYQVGSFIYYSYKPYGEGWKDEMKISEGTGEGDRFPAVDVDTDMNVHIVWCSGDEGDPSDIYYTRFKLKDYFHIPDDPIDPDPIDPDDPVDPDPVDPDDPKPEKRKLWELLMTMYDGGALGSVVDFNTSDGIDMKDYYARFPIAVFSSKVDIAFNITSANRFAFSVGIHGSGVHIDIGPSWSFTRGSWKPKLHFGISIPRKK